MREWEINLLFGLLASNAVVLLHIGGRLDRILKELGHLRETFESLRKRQDIA
jgi:hypothetical protein